MGLSSTIAGHFWTIAPVLRHRAMPRPAPSSQPWSLAIADPQLGTVTLRGLFRDVPSSDAAVVIIHGLGGTTDTHYCTTAAHAAEALGIPCLRLALRGAQRDGEDFYHAGLASDVHAVLRCPELARFSRLYVLGFSLGGHVTLRAALASTADREPRLKAVAAICSPLDLDRGGVHIDSPAAYVYRRHVLTGLKAMYQAVAARRAVPTPLAQVLAARTIREWDSLTVVPRYGFGTVENYYASMSVGPVLSQLSLPALLIQHRDDPMVPEHTYAAHLARELPQLTLKWLPAGGHVGYPLGIDLGFGAQRGVEAQALSWLLRQT